jgi:hypothetical protein
VLEVAAQLGHKPSTCLDIYGRLFEGFDPARRRPAVEVIEEARRAVRDGAVPTEYPGGLRGDDAPGPLPPETPISSGFVESPLSDSNRRPLPYHGSALPLS